MDTWILVGALLAIAAIIVVVQLQLRKRMVSADPSARKLDRLGGYVIERELRTEGVARLYAARSTTDGAVILKVLPQDTLDDPANRRRFEREVRAYVKVVHPNVCRIIDFSWGGEEPPYIAVERVEGETLADLLDAEPMSVERAVSIATQLAKALGALHDNGIVYRNLHPRNIVVGADGTVKLTDFAMARLDSQPELAATTTALAEPQMLSPEQLTRGQDAVDTRSDLYGLGILMYRMLMGRYPFNSQNVAVMLKEICESRIEPLEASNPAIPPALSRVVLRLLDRQPGSRYATASDMLDALKQVQAPV